MLLKASETEMVVVVVVVVVVVMGFEVVEVIVAVGAAEKD